jgi:hypothetical protein
MLPGLTRRTRRFATHVQTFPPTSVAGQWVTRLLAWGQMGPSMQRRAACGLFLVPVVVALGGSCRKGDAVKRPGADDVPIFAGDGGRPADELGRAIHAALAAGDVNSLRRLSAPPSVARCDRRLFPDFVTNWTLRKRKGALQSVGKVTDVSAMAAGQTHRHTGCVAGQTVTSGQILLFVEPLNQGPLTKTIFSPFWIVKPGSDPSPDSGWYLADRLAY